MNEERFHSFDVEVAVLIGMKQAILFNFIANDIVESRIYDENYFDGDYWCARSIESFMEHLPYMSKNTIFRALNKLVEEEFIIATHNPYDVYDRTKWYAIGRRGKRYVETG